MPHDILVLYPEKILESFINLLVLLQGFLTFPRAIQLMSFLGAYNMWYKRRRCFIYHIIAISCWIWYDLQLGAIEQEQTLCIGYVSMSIGWYKWGKDDKTKEIK